PNTCGDTNFAKDSGVATTLNSNEGDTFHLDSTSEKKTTENIDYSVEDINNANNEWFDINIHEEDHSSSQNSPAVTPNINVADDENMQKNGNFTLNTKTESSSNSNQNVNDSSEPNAILNSNQNEDLIGSEIPDPD
ncbi:hypothetical protein HZS_2087, partial [Henneguya salminicola]